MKFGELLKVHQSDLVVSKRYDEWMRENSNPVYSQEALDFAAKQLSAVQRERRGTVSASALGKCPRQQQFTFLGMPALKYTPKTNAIFANGSFMHIRWQMIGLTEGFITEAEVKVGENSLRLSGTMDGVLYDDSVLELKSCNSNAFSRVMSFGPLAGHEDQAGTYAMVSGRDKVVFIYENKDTQEYKEIIRTAEELDFPKLQRNIEELWASIDDKRLAPLLSAFYENKYPCSTCQFRDVCAVVDTWEQAEELVSEHEDQA